MTPIKTLVAVATAMLTLSALTNAASARNFSTTETRSTATFWMEISGGFGTSRCNVTLGQALHARTHAKVLETLIGLITSASVGGCGFLFMTFLRETLPWHIRYAGFAGPLPSITGINTRLIGYAFRFREPEGFIECLATSTATSPTTGRYNREAGGRITSVDIGGTVATSCLGYPVTLVGRSNSITPATTVTLI